MKKISSWVILAVMVLGMCGILLAQGTAAQPVPQTDPLWKKILMGAIGGVIASLIGWAKNRDDKTNTQEPLSLKFMAITVAVGVVVGAITGAMGKTIPDFFSKYESLPVWGLIMMGVEAALKAIFRQSIGMAKIFGIVKSGSENPPGGGPPKP